MAINLWEAKGLPTSYNPLPAGYRYLPISMATEYIFYFRAKSASLGRLHVATDGAIEFSVFPNLKNYYQEFAIPFTNKTKTNFLFKDMDETGDIIIEDIKLVEKPMAVVKQPKKNLLPPFTEWALHANAKVISPYELELNATGQFQSSSLRVNVVGNSSYVFEVEDQQVSSYYYAYEFDISGINLSGGTPLFTTQGVEGKQTKLVTTKANTAYVFIYALNSTTISGKYTFKNPMLILGNTVQPFEPYAEVNPPAVKVPKKNLFDESKWTIRGVESGRKVLIINGHTDTGTKTPTGISKVPVIDKGFKPNTSYTISGKGKKTQHWTAILIQYSEGAGVKIDMADNYEAWSYTTPSDKTIKWINLETGDPARLGYIEEGTFQIEEGTTATPFEPYKEVNRKFVDGVPKKNLVETNAERWGQFTRNQSAGGTPTISPTRIGALEHVEVKEGGTYTISAESGYRVVAQCHVGANTSMPTLLDTGWQSNYTFVAPVGTKVIYMLLKKDNDSNIVPSEVTNGKPQLEEGSATPFVPYLKVNKPTQTGLFMDGVTNYLQLPKMTMDSVEVDCIVDHVNTSAVMIDARPSSGYMYHETSKGAGLINHYIDGAFNVPLTKGKRVKAKVESGSAFTEDITIFSSASYSENLRGTLFGVKCYLNGKVVAEYDFTNRNEKANSVIVGPKSWKLAKR